MKKLAVIASGWHYSSHFYEKIAKQSKVEGWQVDLFVISHRHPENENTIKEKEQARNYSGTDLYLNLDKEMYNEILTEDKITNLGWTYIEKPNTIGDMEVFNQWSDDYNYSEYDLFLVTHDDNFILSDKIFQDVLTSNMKLYKPIIKSRYGSNNHQFKTELIDNLLEWDFLDNGYSEYIPKAFTPRGSFSFYSKRLVQKLPDNKFNMYEKGGHGILNRVGLTNSVGHSGITHWNTHAGTFRDFLYDNNFVDKTRWISNTKRVSKYCIEGERGFVSNNNAGESHYKNAVKKLLNNYD
tara:strand:+ start:186 stop:1073 length:888 start_codon:yes stop_codon:yes gene_type:complete